MTLARLEEHRRIWRLKPALGDIYRIWFDALLSTLRPGSRVLEVGAGPGFFSTYARGARSDARWIAMDILEAPWNDLVADGACLPLRTETLDAVVAVDLVHHLSQPARFFAEASRTLVPGGHVAVVEPWVTPLSYPVYRWLHEEGCRMELDPWDPFGFGEAAGKDAFQGDAAVVTRLVERASSADWRALGFEPPETTVLNGFAYLLSMGFSPASLLPRRFVPLFLALDRQAARFARLVGMRVLAVWRRRGRA